MNEPKQFLFLDVGLQVDRQTGDRIKAGLKERGAAVEEMPLEGNYDRVLDYLEKGAVPVVLKA